MAWLRVRSRHSPFSDLGACGSFGSLWKIPRGTPAGPVPARATPPPARHSSRRPVAVCGWGGPSPGCRLRSPPDSHHQLEIEGGEDQQQPLQGETAWIELKGRETCLADATGLLCQGRLTETALTAQGDQQQRQLGWGTDDQLLASGVDRRHVTWILSIARLLEIRVSAFHLKNKCLGSVGMSQRSSCCQKLHFCPNDSRSRPAKLLWGSTPCQSSMRASRRSHWRRCSAA